MSPCGLPLRLARYQALLRIMLLRRRTVIIRVNRAEGGRQMPQAANSLAQPDHVLTRDNTRHHRSIRPLIHFTALPSLHHHILPVGAAGVASSVHIMGSLGKISLLLPFVVFPF